MTTLPVLLFARSAVQVGRCCGHGLQVAFPGLSNSAAGAKNEASFAGCRSVLIDMDALANWQLFGDDLDECLQRAFMVHCSVVWCVMTATFPRVQSKLQFP